MAKVLTFREAADHVIPFGKHKGRTIGEVGDDDEGLLYLDWMVGVADRDRPLHGALVAYLRDPSVAPDLDAAVERRGGD
jgi:hypothetical protein